MRRNVGVETLMRDGMEQTSRALPYHLGLNVNCNVMLTYFPVSAAVCENQMGDGECASLMARADYCTLEPDKRCQCAKVCKAPAACNGN